MYIDPNGLSLLSGQQATILQSIFWLNSQVREQDIEKLYIVSVGKSWGEWKCIVNLWKMV
jgi:hypothetical protein